MYIHFNRRLAIKYSFLQVELDKEANKLLIILFESAKDKIFVLP